MEGLLPAWPWRPSGSRAPRRVPTIPRIVRAACCASPVPTIWFMPSSCLPSGSLSLGYKVGHQAGGAYVTGPSKSPGPGGSPEFLGGLWHVLSPLTGVGGVKRVLCACTGRPEAWPGLWTPPPAPFPFADCTWRPPAVASHSPEHSYLRSLSLPPGRPPTRPPAVPLLGSSKGQALWSLFFRAWHAVVMPPSFSPRPSHRLPAFNFSLPATRSPGSLICFLPRGSGSHCACTGGVWAIFPGLSSAPGGIVTYVIAGRWASLTRRTEDKLSPTFCLTFFALR